MGKKHKGIWNVFEVLVWEEIVVWNMVVKIRFIKKVIFELEGVLYEYFVEGFQEEATNSERSTVILEEQLELITVKGTWGMGIK